MNETADLRRDDPSEDSPDEEQDLETVLSDNARLLDEFLSRGDAEAPEISQEVTAEHRSGFAAIIGKPNVGKSTLINALLGEKLAIVSPKPQTTRTRQLGILTLPYAQIVFVDTPGVHLARNRLGEYMVEVATGEALEADVLVFIVDVSQPHDAADLAIADLVNQHQEIPAVLALNKRDLLLPADEPEQVTAYQSIVPHAAPLLISAVDGTNQEALLALIVDRLPIGPRLYPHDQLTDTKIRDNVAEIIREQILLQYQHEIPHAVAVQVDEFKEPDDDVTYIAATIYVERESQKAILIGKEGQALKELGRQARIEAENLLNTRVFLRLWVKVLKNWRKDPQALRRLGYDKRK
jgi:GTP-binding protein Era